MKKLWIAFIVLATLGSIYPFNFQLVELDATRISAFLQTCCRMLGRGDILGNVLLFVPIGFTGVLARQPNVTTSRHLIYVCVVATSVALVLQLLQIYLPSRDENLQDVVWNLFGTGCGAVSAGFVRISTTSSDGVTADAAIVPLTLIGAWLIYRLIPFVPSIDFQLIKDSIKPILSLQMAPVNVIRDVAAWSIVAYLLKEAQVGRSLDNYLAALITSVLILEVLIVDNQVNLSNVFGAILAVLLWSGVLRHYHWQKGALVAMLILTLVLSGLYPFDIRMEAAPFNWIPFKGLLGGSMYVNTQSAAEKVFLYGSLVYLLWQFDTKFVGGVTVTLLFVTTIEIAQTALVGHTPEITDPLLVVCAAMTLVVLHKQEDNSGLLGSLRTSFETGRLGSARSSSTKPSRLSRAWVNTFVNLRQYQAEFLRQLSQEMGVSVSAAIREIVAQRMAEPKNPEPPTSTVIDDDSIEIRQIRGKQERKGGGGRERWTKHSVNYRQEQFQHLSRMSEESGDSVSKITRQTIELFIDGLGDDIPNK